MRRVILVAHEDNGKQMIDWLTARRQDFSVIDFFVSHPCPLDVDALLRLAFVHNIPIALNPLTAENHIDSLLKGRETIRKRSGAEARARRQQSERKTA